MSFLRKPPDPHSTSPLFPTFLLPSVSFRRRSRQSSTDSDISTSSFFTNTTSATSPSILSDLDPNPVAVSTDKFLTGHTSHLRCNRCSTDLCLTSQIISKGFTGRHGRAYLVQGHASHRDLHSPSSTLLNTYQNKAVPRELSTGHHTVSDISCAVCGSVLGWKYVEAQKECQKYKVGKFILETKRIRGSVNWENGDGGVDWSNYETPPDQILRATGDAVEFDSQDEDECEDLFAGVWSTELALKRRRGRRFGRANGVGGGSGTRTRSEDVELGAGAGREGGDKIRMR